MAVPTVAVLAANNTRQYKAPVFFRTGAFHLRKGEVVMAQNKPAAAKEKHVWSTGDQKIGK